MFVAECREIAVVTQGPSLDELLRNLREALGLYMSDGRSRGVGPGARIAPACELRDLGVRSLMVRPKRLDAHECD